MTQPEEREIDIARARERLQAIYAQLEQEVAKAGPVCELSGRCCRFAEYGHTLFLSAPEAAVLVADAPAACRPLDDGATCPWQDAAGRCTAREARPLGCRVYFCDPSYAERMNELAEASIRALKRVVMEEGWNWGYARLHEHLRAAVEAGRLRVPEGGARAGSEE